MNYLIIGEPCGHTTLHLIEQGISPENIYVWEDSTKGQYCVTMEGATVTDNLDDYNGMRFDVVIGNPPYGNGGKLAVKFLNKSFELSDDVRLVLPLSIRRPSLSNMIDTNFVCIEDTELPTDTFNGDIKTCIQRWVRSDIPREKIQVRRTHDDFEFVKREEGDIMIGRCGSGPAGRVKTKDFAHYKKDHFFIKANEEVILRLIGLEDEFREASGVSNGMRVLSKHDLVTIYSRRYD